MRILITGGAGFIGSNVAQRFIRERNEVIVFDNLSRVGTGLNLDWLKAQGNFTFIKGDIRNKHDIEEVFKKYSPLDAVFHFAAQPAVTTSVLKPFEDFEINALGTLNLLEVCRQVSLGKEKNKPIFIFSSTNKVYGDLESVNLIETPHRYEFETLSNGVDESTSLDFYSPYGCSKGAADQYVRDYARIYGMRTLVFRMSCIYGTRQFGIEDQGWVAWFIIAFLLGKPLTIYGNGKQLRDILFIEDYVNLCSLALKNIEEVKGKTYNIGGGRANTASLLELIEFVEKLSGKKVEYNLSEPRPGDQLVYVSDIRKAEQELGWKPVVNAETGIRKLYNWIAEEKEEISKVLK